MFGALQANLEACSVHLIQNILEDVQRTSEHINVHGLESMNRKENWKLPGWKPCLLHFAVGELHDEAPGVLVHAEDFHELPVQALVLRHAREPRLTGRLLENGGQAEMREDWRNCVQHSNAEMQERPAAFSPAPLEETSVTPT